MANESRNSVVRRDQTPNVGDAVKFFKDFSVAAGSTFIAKTVIAPIERIKLILQVLLQNAQKTISFGKHYRGILDCFMRIPVEQGFLAFWRGNLVNVTRACSQESLGFAFKDFFKIWCLNGVDKRDFWRFTAGNLGAGAASGVTTYCVIHPLDFVRTRLAMDMGKGASREFTGFFNCFYKIFSHDGIRGLYFGFLPSIQYIFLYRGAYYGLFDSAKALLVENDSNSISFISAFIVGQVTTILAAVISYPLDTVRRRLMMQAGRDDILYSGMWHCTTKIWYEEGFPAYFNGFWVNTIRGVGAALILALYNEFSKYV